MANKKKAKTDAWKAADAATAPPATGTEEGGA